MQETPLNPGTRVPSKSTIVMDPKICIYQHDAATLMPVLATHLPYTLTLLRRIQHGITYPFATSQILATFPPDSPPDPGQPWLAARVDLFRGRETQILIYSSLEKEHTSIPAIDAVNDSSSKGAKIFKTELDSLPQSNSIAGHSQPGKAIVSSFSASQPVLDLARSQLLTLLSYIKTHLLPSYLSSLKISTQATSSAETLRSSPGSAKNPAVNNAMPLIPAPDPRAFLIGSLHTGLYMLLQRSRDYTTSDSLPNIRVHRTDDPPYYKYFFRGSGFCSGEGSRSSAGSGHVDLTLPIGYRFFDRQGREGVQGKHLDLVQSRTSIPRSRAQLSTMSSVAVYLDSQSTEISTDEQPIAWGFLGMDGALSTLHIEPEHRGRGLAAPLAKAVMQRGMASDGLFGATSFKFEDTQMNDLVRDWAHTEVAAINKASRRVMEKLGGQVLTTVAWAVIELCD